MRVCKTMQILLRYNETINRAQDGTYKDCRLRHVVRFGNGPVSLFVDRSLYQPTITLQIPSMDQCNPALV